MAKLVAACVGLGALSLALPSELSYDPWAWLVWDGRSPRRMELHRQLAEAVRRAGGAEAVNRFGPASVNRALETHLAWKLARPIEEIETASGQGVVFSSFREFLAGSVRSGARRTRSSSRGPAAGTSTCAGPFTRLLQGVHTRVPGSRNADAKGV
jgi:hypothetical protein